MKKFLCAMFAVVLPISLVCGCSVSGVLAKTDTNKNAPDFLVTVTESLAGFKNNIQSKLLTNQTFGEEIAQDETASVVYTEEIWPMLEKANDENLFALLAYNMARQNQARSFFDISFLSDVQSEALKNFFIKRIKLENNTAVYVAKLSGLENASLNLPLPMPSKTDFVDNADSAIKQLGNYLAITVTTDERSSTIEVDTMFMMPTEDEVVDSIANKNITPAYNEADQSILLKYSESGITYTKEIKFETSSSGKTIKKVTRFAGDKLTNPNISDGVSYEYALKTPDVASRDLLWSYDITFSAADSGLYCKQKQGNHTVTTEYFLTAGGEIVGRLYESTSAQRKLINVFVHSNLGQGKLKYSFQVAGLKDGIKAALLRSEPYLTTAFCDITTAENQLAINNNSSKFKTIKYDVTSQKIALSYAGNKG